ncbi:zinc ABC transporter substrate-binding protein [Bacillus tianshenii]|uniref:metal ABC transporter solute-binding protein, Zn/Mn family n=1 Tax=Sutcliffiella tianshenii TaxID=1463404 RepID=UPI001CD725F6|nr:zinc ABC transporter substrate-binding protein [Bacillus tianshenii]MCA1319994.1 zinc ABC transporter substrate-binding protein [Bacillus tianshenii]
MKNKSILSILILILFTFLVGCNSDNQSSEGRLTVYTTIFPLEDFTNKIGGDHVDVKSVYPPGADAHTFEPSTKTMSEMASADAFIYTGVGVEGFADKAKDVLENEEVKVVAAAQEIELMKEDEHAHEEDAHGEDEHAHEEDAHGEDEHAHEEDALEEDEHADEEDAHEEDEHAHEEDAHGEDEHNHADGDPHVWLSPTLSISLAENIKNALVELKPEAKEDFEANFQSLKEELEALDSEYKETMESAKTNKILVSHAAYGYWEKEYGLEQISVTGLSPTQEPSQKQLTEIIETAKEYNIQYVIFDQNISGKIAEVVKNEIKAEALTLHNLEAATEEDVNNEEDYFSLMRKNLETLKKALN